MIPSKSRYLFLFSLLMISVMCSQEHVDIYHGVKIKDEYKYLEDLKDSSVYSFFKSHQEKTVNIISAIPNKDKLITLQNEFGAKKNEEYRSIIESREGKLYYLKRGKEDQLFKLYYRESLRSKEELLYSPDQYQDKEGNSYSINYHKPSWDNAKIIIGLTKKGEELSLIKILDLKTKKILPGGVNNCFASVGGVNWLPDNTGFIYFRVPESSSQNKEKKRYFNTEAALYTLNDSSKTIFSKKNNPNISIKPEDFAVVVLEKPEDNYAFGVPYGASPYYDLYYTPIEKLNDNSQILWKSLFKKNDKIVSFDQQKDSIIYLTAKESSNFKICKTSIVNPNFNNPTELVSEYKDQVINSFGLTSHGLVYTTTKNGVLSQLYIRKLNGSIEKIPLPFVAGTLALSTKGSNYDYMSIRIKGWLYEEERYIYDFDKKSWISSDLTNIEKEDTSTNEIIVEELEIPSHDGVLVPLSIIYKKELKKDGKNPVFLTGYGAYGRTLEPRKSQKILTWVEEGGIYAIAHVRGGGEKGDKWYSEGYKQTKPNTWKDLIASTEYLIKNKYTTKGKIAIHGASAGGITVGRAMTERPDLFGAVIISVGIINTVRLESGFNGKNNAKEFGSIQDPDEFKSLLEMDAFHHIKKGGEYPATLLNVGMNDARVPPWHSAKFVAKLEDYKASNEPVIFMVDFDSGHKTSSIKQKRIEDMANILAFALWKTGHPDYQLKK